MYFLNRPSPEGNPTKEKFAAKDAKTRRHFVSKCCKTHLFHPEIKRRTDNGSVDERVGKVLADLLELVNTGHASQRDARQEDSDLSVPRGLHSVKKEQLRVRRDHNASRPVADVRAEGAYTPRKTLMCENPGCCDNKALVRDSRRWASAAKLCTR